jgi:hypothetical protein
MSVPNRRFTKLFRIPENKELLISFFQEGKHDKFISDYFQCDHTSVRRQRIKMGFAPTKNSSKKQITRAVAAQIVEMIALGKSDSIIAMTFGIKLKNIQDFRKRRYSRVEYDKVGVSKTYRDYLKEAEDKTSDKFKWMYSPSRITHKYHETIIV